MDSHRKRPHFEVGRIIVPDSVPGFRGLVAICSIWLLSATAFGGDLYVSPTGNDSVPYGQVTIGNPWKTIGHAVYNLRAGDTLYIRSGTYTPQYPMIVRSDSQSRQDGGNPNEVMNAESGTAANPVIIKAYPGESPIVDCKNVNIWLDLDRKEYWTVEGLDFRNAQSVIRIGYNTQTFHTTIRDNRMTMSRGGDNTAAIALVGERAEYTTIEANRIEGPGNHDSVHGNTSTIYLRLVKNVKILGNILTDAPIGLYYKHATLAGTNADTDIEIAFNFIARTRRNAMQLNTNRAHIHDNIFGASNASVLVAEANGSVGGDDNRFVHNTFFNTQLTLKGDSNNGDTRPGAVGNLIQDNLFVNSLISIHYYKHLQHDTTTDFNLHSSNPILLEYGTSYSLSEWQKRNGDSLGSMTGAPQFVGGGSPASISDFALAPGSRGAGAASDGKDLGADTTMVGKYAPVRPEPPIDLN